MSKTDSKKTTTSRTASKSSRAAKPASASKASLPSSPALPQSNQDEVCATYLKAIGDPLRMKIVRSLQNGPLNVTDIAEMVEQEIGLVSHHLRVLYHAKVIASRREGKFIFYSLNEQWRAPDAAGRPGLLDFGCCQFDIGRPSRSASR